MNDFLLSPHRRGQWLTLFLIIIIATPVGGFGQNTFSSKVYEELDVMVTMRDGVKLSTNIYRPDSSGSYPVLLLRTPYGNNEKGRQGECFFVQHGYAVVVQDTRGRYESEGVFDAFQFEATDGFDTQEWIGEQRWCNGKIGTFGGSYEGVTQWLPATLQSKYLQAMFASKTFSNLHNEIYQGGAFRILRFCPWSYEMTRPISIAAEDVSKKYDSLYHNIPLNNFEKLLGWNIPFLKDWMTHPQSDRYWARTSVSDYSKVKVPVYNLAGWFDSFLNGTIQNYLKMVDSAIDPQLRLQQKLIIGPWLHASESRKTGDLDFGQSADIHTKDIQLRWFDAQLKEDDNGIMSEPPIKIFVMGANTWRYENEWPLARTKYKNYYFQSKGRANTLNSDGAIDTIVAGGNYKNTFIYDPRHPVPTTGNLSPVDQRSVEAREDVLVFSTSPLEKDIEATGPVLVTLYASSSATNTDFTAKLVDVYPDGRAIALREGIIRTSAGHSHSALQPGKIYKFDIDLWATSNVFKAGHRIRVEISSSNFPMFDRNLNTSGLPSAATKYAKALQTIYHSKQYPSCITLPIITD